LSLKNGTIIIAFLEMLAGLGYIIGGSIIVSDAEINGIVVIKLFAAVGALMITSGILLLLTAIILLVGALREGETLLLPWLTYMLTFIITNTCLNIFAATHYNQMGHEALGSTNAAVTVLVLLIQVYFLFVVYGLYRELKGTASPNYPTPSAPRPWTVPA